ncbi:MAG: RDD family protein, partial [Candidatus Limnocylindrales bacterium]
FSVISVLIGAGYFIYTWTSMRATVGMKALGMQIGNAADGATLTQDQAIRRYLALAAPGIVGSALAGLPVIGALLSLLSLAWVIYLLYTTAQSPTKQGFHDVFAKTMVVKAARNVG